MVSRCHTGSKEWGLFYQTGSWYITIQFHRGEKSQNHYCLMLGSLEHFKNLWHFSDIKDVHWWGVWKMYILSMSSARCSVGWMKPHRYTGRIRWTNLQQNWYVDLTIYHTHRYYLLCCRVLNLMVGDMGGMAWGVWWTFSCERKWMYRMHVISYPCISYTYISVT